MNDRTLGFELQDAPAGYVFDVGSLRDELETLVDQHDPRGKRWPLALILLFAVLAKLAGEDKVRGIAQWVNLRIGWLSQVLQLVPRCNRKGEPSGPHATTYGRVFAAALAVEALEPVVQRVAQRSARPGRGVQVTVDGKKIHGTLSADNPSGVYLLAAYLPEQQLVLCQVAITSDQNELSQAPQLLESLDLRGKIVTADALFTQRNLSIQLIEAGGEYVWKVKENQPQLLKDIQTLFESPPSSPGAAVPPVDLRTVTQPDVGHGRIEWRTLTASSDLKGYLDWPAAEQVFRYEYQWHRLSSDKRGHSVTYGITSLTAHEADAASWLRLVRGHWRIENGLHYRREVTLHEDQCHLRQGHAAQVMAALNNLVVSLVGRLGWHSLPEARRSFAAHPEQALALLLQAL